MTPELPSYENLGIFSSLFSQFPGYLFLKDRSHRFILCNQNYANVLGLESYEDIQGLYDSDLPWSQDENELYIQDDIVVMDSKNAALNIIESQTDDVGARPIITSKYPILSKNGCSMGVLGIFYYPSEMQRDSVLISQISDRVDDILKLDRKKSYAIKLESNEIVTMSFYEVVTSMYLVLGYSAKMIALHLSKSVRTVEHYVEDLRRKLNVGNKYLLVQVLVRSNLSNLLYYPVG